MPRVVEARVNLRIKAIELAKEIVEEVLFLNVFDQVTLPRAAMPILINVQAQMDRMRNYLRRTAKIQARRAGVESEVFVRAGSLREQIAIVAGEQQVDLVILGNPMEKSCLFKREALPALAT